MMEHNSRTGNNDLPSYDRAVRLLQYQGISSSIRASSPATHTSSIASRNGYAGFSPEFIASARSREEQARQRADERRDRHNEAVTTPIVHNTTCERERPVAARVDDGNDNPYNPMRYLERIHAAASRSGQTNEPTNELPHAPTAPPVTTSDIVRPANPFAGFGSTLTETTPVIHDTSPEQERPVIAEIDDWDDNPYSPMRYWTSFYDDRNRMLRRRNQSPVISGLAPRHRISEASAASNLTAGSHAIGQTSSEEQIRTRYHNPYGSHRVQSNINTTQLTPSIPSSVRVTNPYAGFNLNLTTPVRYNTTQTQDINISARSSNSVEGNRQGESASSQRNIYSRPIQAPDSQLGLVPVRVANPYAGFSTITVESSRERQSRVDTTPSNFATTPCGTSLTRANEAVRNRGVESRGLSQQLERPRPPVRVTNPYAGFSPGFIQAAQQPRTSSSDSLQDSGMSRLYQGSNPSAPVQVENSDFYPSEFDHRAALDLPPSYDEVMSGTFTSPPESPTAPPMTESTFVPGVSTEGTNVLSATSTQSTSSSPQSHETAESLSTHISAVDRGVDFGNMLNANTLQQESRTNNQDVNVSNAETTERLNTVNENVDESTISSRDQHAGINSVTDIGTSETVPIDLTGPVNSTNGNFVTETRTIITEAPSVDVSNISITVSEHTGDDSDTMEAILNLPAPPSAPLPENPPTYETVITRPSRRVQYTASF